MDLDIYHFINSIDMQKYLRDISYQFSISEAAFVVYWSEQATLKEKISAWKYIISSMPDCTLQRNHVEFESYHSFLRSYIRLIERDIEQFYTNFDDKSIYSYEYHKFGNDGWYGKNNEFFSDHQSCIAAIQEELSDSDKIDEIRVYRYPLNEYTHSSSSQLLMNRKLEIMGIDAYHEERDDIDILYAFEDCCFNFPSPFQRGDIVICYATRKDPSCRPFVLSNITTWDSKELTEKGFCRDCSDHCDWGWPWQWGRERERDKRVTRLLDRGDCIDMHAIGYCVDHEDGVVYSDNTLIPVIDLEYYHGPLEGFERQLKLFSCYEKGKTSDVPVDAQILVNGCLAIRAEELAKKIADNITVLYLEEDMLQLGIKKK